MLKNKIQALESIAEGLKGSNRNLATLLNLFLVNSKC